MISNPPSTTGRVFAGFILTITGSLAFADSELPVFVAENGVDDGDCTSLDAPCATIGYALSRAAKGSQIRVATGRFDLDDAADIVRIVSGATDVVGGYEFTQESPGAPMGRTVLAGVPAMYREQLAARGFDIIADQKASSNQAASELARIDAAQSQLKAGVAAANCVGGSASGLPCVNVDLLSHVSHASISATPSAGNDIWGFVDLNTGREYVIAGYSIGTAIFDVTDATNPREVGFVDGQAEIWRDMKVYQYFDGAANRWNAYAYVTTDGSTTDGLIVIDLTGLPHSITRINYPSDILSAHNIYATNTDYSTGLSLTGTTPTLIVAGSNVSTGQFRTYSLANPSSPSFVSGGIGSGYMHDASSVIITDARKDTQCINGTTYCEVLLDYNEDAIELWDITDAANPMRLSATPYANRGYTHSGWWSEDKQYLFVQDETDETGFNLSTTLRVFSMADLRAPTIEPGWVGPTGAIDHNGFVRGNRYYMSNYSRGLTVLDITNPAIPVSAGRLDTFPGSDVRDFRGAWGTYPFFHSGNIAISDRDSGMYMAADQTRAVAEGLLQFSAASFATDEGQQAQLVVERTVGTTGAVSVGYEIIHATADTGDYTTATGVLNWSNGDGSNRTIDINAVNDGVAEPVERLLVRLVNPTGGATLGNLNTTSAWISDPGSASELNFAEPTINMTERGFATIVAVIHRSGSGVGNASVDLTVGGSATAGNDYIGTVPATINWAAGDANPKMVEISIVDDGTGENDETFTLTMSNPTGATIGATDSFSATIFDGSGSNLAPNALAGVNQTRPSGSTVTLNGSQSNDPNGDPLDFQWTQIAGQSVTLTDATSAMSTFTAPTVNSDTMLQFRLTVTDPLGLADSAIVTITVVSGAPATSGGGGGSAEPLFLLMLALFAARRRIRRTGLV